MHLYNEDAESQARGPSTAALSLQAPLIVPPPLDQPLRSSCLPVSRAVHPLVLISASIRVPRFPDISAFIQCPVLHPWLILPVCADHLCQETIEIHDGKFHQLEFSISSQRTLLYLEAYCQHRYNLHLLRDINVAVVLLGIIFKLQCTNQQGGDYISTLKSKQCLSTQLSAMVPQKTQKQQTACQHRGHALLFWWKCGKTCLKTEVRLLETIYCETVTLHNRLYTVG